ncbi:MAG: hypothetical protein R3C56_19425 [Pirellulaceae bacterium]
MLGCGAAGTCSGCTSGIVLFLVLVLTASSMVYSVQVSAVLFSFEAKAAENAAQDANLRAQENLFDSYVAQARALRQTRRPGQRIDSLQAISQAAELMHSNSGERLAI